MAIMVTLTLKTDPATYERLHGQMLAAAIPAGMLFHSGHEADGQVRIVDFWPSEDAWHRWEEGPLAEGMRAAGITPPDDLKITPVLNADLGGRS
jgi:hypothetical protein